MLSKGNELIALFSTERHESLCIPVERRRARTSNCKVSGVHLPELPVILVYHRIAVFISPSGGVIETDLLLDAIVIPHQVEHVAGVLLAKKLDQLVIPHLGQIEVGGGLDIQVGRATVEFIENTQIDLALPGPQFLLDVPDHEVMLNVPDQTVPFDLAVGHGASDLDQITNLDWVTGQDGAAPRRGQRCSGSPGLRPAIAGIVSSHFKRGLAVGKHHRVEKIPSAREDQVLGAEGGFGQVLATRLASRGELLNVAAWRMV